jgi:hypothetical protein
MPTLTLCEAPALNELLIGLMTSQPELLALDADHEPSAPQLFKVTVWATGLPCPCVAVKASDPGLALMHGGGGCTVNVTETACRVVPELVVRMKVRVSL